MFKQKPATIEDVAALQLCCGCGCCAYLNPNTIEMIDTFEYGRRPRVRHGGSPEADVHELLRICPGVGLDHAIDDTDPTLIQDLLHGWGPVREVWEGFASDSEIRFLGSSGGVVTALALYCVEKSEMAGALHTAARPDVPYLNHTVLSTDRDGLLAGTGSRYAPASPCDGLQMIEDSGGPCVFIGKPCDVAAAFNATHLRPSLGSKLGLTVGIFCAGTPSIRGTARLLNAMGVGHLSSVQSIRYRGCGWPGKTSATFCRNGVAEQAELTYEQSWGEILQKHRQWRCYICPDHTGEFADIAVGDPWYRQDRETDQGRSLVLVRTERGQRILHAAMDAGYLVLEKAHPAILPASQPGLLQSRGALWGRLQTLRVMGAATPQYRGMAMFRFWRSELTLKQKLQSFYGTAKRVFKKHLRQRQTFTPFRPPTVAPDAHTAAAKGQPN